MKRPKQLRQKVNGWYRENMKICHECGYAEPIEGEEDVLFCSSGHKKVGVKRIACVGFKTVEQIVEHEALWGEERKQETPCPRGPMLALRKLESKLCPFCEKKKLKVFFVGGFVWTRSAWRELLGFTLSSSRRKYSWELECQNCKAVGGCLSLGTTNNDVLKKKLWAVFLEWPKRILARVMCAPKGV